MLATGKAANAAPATSAAPRDRADARQRAGVLVNVLVPFGLAVAALVIRLPYLESAPRFRDETFSQLRAVAISRGQMWPLTDIEQYVGAFYTYVVAAVFKLIGPGPYVARQVVTWFGAATVGATYLLGREVGGAAVGLIAAGLLLTNGVHIAALGHVGFSAHITPLFMTLGCWQLHRAALRESGRSLAAAGFFLGMALQTHPTTVAFLPGAIGWLLWRQPRWIVRRSSYVAAGLFLLAYSPLILFNVQTGGESIRHAVYTATERPDYARGRSTSLTPESYLERQQDSWMMTYRIVGGGLDERDGARDYLLDPALLAMAALAVAGVGWAAWRGYALPLWLVASFALILPLANANHYDVVGDANYFGKALPPVYAAMGLLVVDLARGGRRVFRGDGRARALTVALGLLVVGLMLSQLVPLWRFYAQALRANPTNASLIRAAGEVQSGMRPGDIVVLDTNLNNRRVENASDYDEASTYRVIRLMLELEAVPYETIGVDRASLAELASRGQGAVVVLSSGIDGKDTAELGDLIEQFGLLGLDGQPKRAPRPADRYGLFRFDPGAGRR